MPKIIGLKERVDGPVEGCGGCGVIMGITKQSLISQRCPHCYKPFCMLCYLKHDQVVCEVRHKGLRKKR